MLTIDQENKQTIYLTEDKASWINIDYLSDDLKDYAIKHFDELFNLHPLNRGKVLVFNGEKENKNWVETECSRWYETYGKTPKFDDTVMKSYMFSGNNNINTSILPDLYQPFNKYMINKDDRYNQIVINWYDSKNDYIPLHSDCEAHMIDNHVISLINLNENNNHYRVFNLIAKDNVATLYKNIDIVLKHGIIITMGGNIQQHFRHGVKPVDNDVCERISISFRQF